MTKTEKETYRHMCRKCRALQGCQVDIDGRHWLVCGDSQVLYGIGALPAYVEGSPQEGDNDGEPPSRGYQLEPAREGAK